MRRTGHLQVKGSAGRRRWHALWRDAEGRHQRAGSRACEAGRATSSPTTSAASSEWRSPERVRLQFEASGDDFTSA
jgi:hypothetical protein